MVEGDLSGTEMAGAAAAARVVAWSWGTGQRAARWEEEQMGEKTLAERGAEAHAERRSPVMEEGGRA